MELIDYIIFAAYLIAMVGVGLYFYLKNQSVDDYFVGGRNIGSLHIGMSVVATDVGGGFSIGLGGLGFAMGLSGFLDVIYWARGCLAKRGMVDSSGF